MKAKTKEHLALMAAQPCAACAKTGREQQSRTCLHHIRSGYGLSQRASDWEVIPLCEGHHQGLLDVSCQNPFHQGSRAFRLMYGTEGELLAEAWERAGLDFETLPDILGHKPPWLNNPTWDKLLEKERKWQDPEENSQNP